jgi:RNA polymerase-associated protein LEO1
VDDGQPQLTAEEVAARQALEYREEDMHYVEVQEKVAAVSLLKLPTPHSSDGQVRRASPGCLRFRSLTLAQYWHIKLPSYLRIDENEFDEMMYEEPAGDAEDFPEENVIRWRWAEVNGQRVRARSPWGTRCPLRSPPTQVRESNARIVQWSDGSQALQVGAEFFNVNITSSRAVDDDAPKNDAVNGHASSSSSLLPIAGLTLLVAQHSGAYLLEAQAAITGTMSLTPYNVTSTAHRRLATTLSDRHAKVTRTQAVVLERDPEIERAQRDKADADRAKQARRERAKASGGGGAARRRRGLGRSMRIDRSDDEDEEAMDEGDSDEPRGATGTRTSGRPGTGAGGRRPAYLDGPDEDDNGFVVESEDDGAGEAAEEEGAPDDDLDDLEARAEQAARKAKGARRPAQSSDRDAEGEVRCEVVSSTGTLSSRRWTSTRRQPSQRRRSSRSASSSATTMTTTMSSFGCTLRILSSAPQRPLTGMTSVCAMWRSVQQDGAHPPLYSLDHVPLGASVPPPDVAIELLGCPSSGDGAVTAPRATVVENDGRPQACCAVLLVSVDDRCGWYSSEDEAAIQAAAWAKTPSVLLAML